MSVPGIPPVETQADVDAKQDELIIQLQQQLADAEERRRAQAEIIESQGFYMPDSLTKKDDAPVPPPEPQQELTSFGTNGYRVFPINGGFFSLRDHEDQWQEKIREQFVNQYSIERQMFWERRTKDANGKWVIAVVPPPGVED